MKTCGAALKFNLKSGVPVSQVSPAKIIHSHLMAQMRAEGLSKENELDVILARSRGSVPAGKAVWQETTDAGVLSRSPAHPKEKNPA